MSLDGYVGSVGPAASLNAFNATTLMVQNMLRRLNTAVPVKVIACTNTGGVSLVGTVDVQPLVNMLDGAGQPITHGTIYKLPYVRVQGGSNAIILDPQAGDIGVMVCCARDISGVANAKGAANPASGREFSLSDGIYVGTCIGTTAPTQYIQFDASGVTVVSPHAVKVQCDTAEVDATTSATITTPTTTVNGNLAVNGDVSVTGDTTFTGSVHANGHAIDQTHKHTGVSTGSGVTGTVV